MPDLIAQGPNPGDRWRRKLQPGIVHVIGRQTDGWAVPWDQRVSRQHVQVAWQGGRLEVTELAAARNPVFFRGQPSERFDLKAGEHFVIGETTFTLVDEQANVSLDVPQPAGERTFSAEELRGRPFREADKRIDALSRLPDIVRGATSDAELLERLVNLLLTGIERAGAAAVVAVEGSGARSQEPVAGGQGAIDNPQSKIPNPQSGLPNPQSAIHNPQFPIAILHWDRRILAGLDFRPSERLIRQAVETGQSVVHVWSSGRVQGSGLRSQEAVASGEEPVATSDGPVCSPESAIRNPQSGILKPGDGPYTLSEGLDWAFCTPVPGGGGDGWALYVTGSFGGDLAQRQPPDAELLRDDVKFAELTAALLGGLREARLLAARQASLSPFFSPVVLSAIGSQDPSQALAPREADVTVLFCDLRGFSRESERSAGDLFGLLRRVSEALGVTTHHILKLGGVVGDFHGDAAMGFWGWPLPEADSVQRACQAALAIRAAFIGSSCRGEVLSDFRVGIGVASGRAVAGKIGTADQVKVTVFGPVVNLASRLETMTRQIQASIIIDPPTATVIAATVPRSVCRVRRLAKVRPVGFSSAIEVSELLPPAHDCPELSDDCLAAYEAALVAFEKGDWTTALKRLHTIPPDDLTKDFLMLFIARHGRVPPPGWDGVIPLEAK
jgi:adenylate cyclase